MEPSRRPTNFWRRRCWARASGLQQLAEAAEAGGATLLRLRGNRPLAGLSSTGWVHADAAMLAGHAPPSPRRFFPDHVFARGFLGDTNVWPDDELRRDPYFQEFLRPRGVFYHAKARLCADGDERISISLKRLSHLISFTAAASWASAGASKASRSEKSCAGSREFVR